MPLTVAILGASGVYARHLIPRLAERGFNIRALVRRPEAAAVAAACGAEVHTADIFDRASLRAALAGCDVGINLATSLPGPSGRGDYAENDRLRREGVPIWLRACEEAGVPRVIQQSIGRSTPAVVTPGATRTVSTHSMNQQWRAPLSPRVSAWKRVCAEASSTG